MGEGGLSKSIFFTKNPIFFLRGGGGWDEGGGGEGLMDGQKNRPKPICLFNFFQVGGHNNVLMYKLCPTQAQFMTILSFGLQV